MSTKRSQQSLGLITSDAADLVRYEKNLLQIGFFGAHERRGSSRGSMSRTVERIVSRDGKKIKATATIEASAAHGLPTTSDQDKYLAFMKLAMDQKRRDGVITNPIRFNGYTLLNVLGLCDSGENYEAINAWGKRLAATTITSEQIIYLSTKKSYMNTSAHVFRSFSRIGDSRLDGSERSEMFEVEIEDWVLDNMNAMYMVPEDFNSYRKLVRPAAKGIFVYLTLWFYASHGDDVHKDYRELCSQLNLRPYDHPSKIKEKHGPSFEELVDIGYLRSWEIKRMETKPGYKIVMSAGDALKDVLTMTRRKNLRPTGEGEVLPSERQEARQALIDLGVSDSKANELARKFDSETLLDRIDYALSQLKLDQNRGNIKNPAGFAIKTIENEDPLPKNYVTRSQRVAAQKRREQAAAVREMQADRLLDDLERQEAYQEWCARRADEFLAREFPGQGLDRKISETHSRLKKDQAYAGLFAVLKPTAVRNEVMKYLRHEAAKELNLPPFEEWKTMHVQQQLF